LGILQHKRRLKVPRTVQPARELKMTLQVRPG
jgi:hypothetical protein